MEIKLPNTIEQNIQHFTGRTWLLPQLLKWLEETEDRMFMLTGEPGTGKSMIVAWLAGAGPEPEDAEARAQLEQIRSLVKAAHFCVAASSSVSPTNFAENVVNQLTHNIPGFSDVLAVTLEDRVRISTVQQVGKMEAGSSVTGVHIERLELGELGEELSFEQALHRPLQKLCANGYNQPILLLVDALDEAATYTGTIDLVRLLKKLSDLPQNVRVLMTTRPDPRVLKFYNKVKPFNLLADAPEDVNDVRLYAYERLAELDDGQRTRLSDRIAQAAQGIFLYAHLVINDLLARLPEIPDLEEVSLPKRLSGLYHDFLNRELGSDENRWYAMFKPFLGLIAVAQGEGLSRTQIEHILNNDIEQPLRICKQYLSGNLPDGPFRPFHQSFADFLLRDKKNVNYHIDAKQMHRQIAEYYLKEYGKQWKDCDLYGLRYLPAHQIQAEEWEGLGQIFANAGFIEAKCTAGMTYELAVDYNEAILRNPDVFRLLENIWNGLSGDHPELLQQLLHRFLYVATIPDQRVLKRVPKEYEIEVSSRVRIPNSIYWPPMIQFLDDHRNEVIECAPNEIAIIAEKWLVQNQSPSYQKEAAELGLAVAWRVFHRNHRYIWYTQKSVNPKTAYRAVLASVPMLPEQATEFALIACGRQEPPPPPPELIEPAKPMPERDPNLPTPPLGSCYPEVEIPPWPEGPTWRIDRHFRDVCLNESEHLVLLIAGYPEIARELILALLIKGPGKRPEDWKTNEFYRDYELAYFRKTPPFYDKGPFLLFLSVNPKNGLDVILRLVNFVTERWKDRKESQSHDIPSVKIPFPDKEQYWFGERLVYTTYRDRSLFPDVVVSALMALERWFYTNLDNKELVTEAIETIVKQTQSLAFAGLLIGIGKKHPTLFKKSLKPFLAVPEFYSWEMQHQLEGEGHQMIGWDRRKYTENQIKQAHEWHTMSHRKLELNTVALSLFLHDEDIRRFIETVREQWQIRLENSASDDPLYDRLAKLIREFDVNNWQQEEEHPGFETLWRYQPPDDFLEQLEKERPQFLDQQHLLLFPFQCRQRLSENQPLSADELDAFWNSLQRTEQLSDDELENFSQQLQENREFRTFDDPDVGKRHVRDALCAGAAVLIQFHRGWLREHPEKEAWCIQTLAETILSPPSPSPLDNEVSVYDMNWDNFCAYAVPILWAEDPRSELWRRLIVRLVTHPHYITVKILFLQAVTHRQELGDDFFRLQHLILQWAWARWHVSPHRHVPKESDRRRKTRRKKVAKRFDKVAKAFIDGALSTELPSWEELAANERGQLQHISKKIHFRQDPGLDIAFIQSAFDSFPLPADARDVHERKRIIAFWKETLRCVLRMLGNGYEEIEEFHETPGDFEGWVFRKIVEVLLQLHSSEERQAFWKPILCLGMPAHYWIESFLLDWLLYGLGSNQHEEIVIQVWKEMLDFVFSSPKWDYNAVKDTHWLSNLWYLLMGLHGHYMDLWDKNKTTIVTQMKDYYERWVQLHLFRGHSSSTFTYFLQTPAAKNICMDGLLWLDQAASTSKSDFRYDSDSLARLLTFCWQNHSIVLRQHSQYWDAFMRLLNRLVRQGNNLALSLSELISSDIPG